MQFGVILLICLILLCVTGVLTKPLHRLGISPWKTTLFALLLIPLNSIKITPLPELSINPAALLLCIGAGASASSKNADAMGLGEMLLSLFCALFAAALMAALHHLLITERLSLPEPGLFLGLLTVPFALLLRKTPGAALFMAVLSPLLFCLLESALELYAFGYATMYLGTPLAFDAAVAGLFASTLCVLPAAPKQKEPARVHRPV